jgi:hypothetical protein
MSSASAPGNNLVSSVSTRIHRRRIPLASVPEHEMAPRRRERRALTVRLKGQGRGSAARPLAAAEVATGQTPAMTRLRR